MTPCTQWRVEAVILGQSLLVNIWAVGGLEVGADMLVNIFVINYY